MYGRRSFVGAEYRWGEGTRGSASSGLGRAYVVEAIGLFPHATVFRASRFGIGSVLVLDGQETSESALRFMALLRSRPAC